MYTVMIQKWAVAVSRQSLGNITLHSPLSQYMTEGSYYRKQWWLRGGDWNGGESGDWKVVTNSDTWIYRGIFGVILYSSDGIY